jgi:hypothetical protein
VQVFVLQGLGDVVGLKFLDIYLKGKYETICYAMYSRRQSVYLRARR